MRNILYKLVNKAALIGEVQKLKKTALPDKWLPDITISRDPGSGGRVIAKMVARKLKWRLLDRGILVALAKELGIPESEFAHVDEHARSWLADMLHSMLNRFYVSDVAYVHHLKTLLLHVAKTDSVVVVGRGANHILPQDKILRVRITAPRSERIKNTMKFEHKTRVSAEAWVDKIEKKRNTFVFQYFGKSAYSPANYDITINTEHLSLESARDMIIDAFYDKFPKMRRK